MDIILSPKLILLSILQYLYGFSETFPQNKNCKSDVFQSICINLFCLKNNTHVNELMKAIEKEPLELIYKQIFLSEINGNKDNYIISTLLDFIQEEESWKEWFSAFSKHYHIQLEQKIRYLLEDFNTYTIHQKLLKKYNLNTKEIYIIYNGLSNFDYVFQHENRLYYCAGDFLGYDELDFLDINPFKKSLFYAHLISKLLQQQTANSLKLLSKNELEKSFKKINPLLAFKKCWNTTNNFDFLSLYISFYYVIDELKALYPQSVGYYNKILQMKGIILSSEIASNEFCPIKLITKIDTADIQELFSSNLPSKDEINTILSKYTDYYNIDSKYIFKKQLLQICKNNFFIFIGEFHKCDEHYSFLAKCINEFYLHGFENVFWEKSRDCQDEINDYIFNKSETMPSFLPLRERAFIEKVREINLKNNNKLHIYCYDLPYEDFDSQDFSFSEREKKCYLEIAKRINDKKSIFLSGFLHCNKKLTNASILMNENLYSMIKSKYSEKSIFSIFINSFSGRFLTYQNNKPVNWDINVTESFIEPYDITALVSKRKNVISFINLSYNLDNNEKYIGYTEFGNITFDNNIATLSSGGFSIHKLGEEFDGMIIYPKVDWMNGEKY